MSSSSERGEPALSLRAQLRPHALQQTVSLFNDIVGARRERRRHVKAERLGSLEVDYELEFCSLIDW
jgi:hypothetical protein